MVCGRSWSWMVAEVSWNTSLVSDARTFMIIWYLLLHSYSLTHQVVRFSVSRVSEAVVKSR